MLPILQTMAYAPLTSLGSPLRARWLVAATCMLLLAAAGTGFGSSPSSHIVRLNVDGTITLTEPTSVDAAPAPTAGVSWTSGAPNVLDLGEIAGQDIATASATWLVSTNNPFGYELSLSNAGSAPVLQGAASFPDMPSSPGAIDPTKSAFGVAVGDSAAHNQAAVDNVAGQPWGTSGTSGTQGTLYRGIPTAGMLIGTRGSIADDDPVTVNFAANLSSSEPLPFGAYSGLVRFTAVNL